jgi:subtilisin
MGHEKCVRGIQLHIMTLLKTPLLLASAAMLILAGCSKKDKINTPSSMQPDDCVVGKSSSNGDIIDGQYIVVYKTTAVAARGMTAQRLDQISEDALSRNAIPATSLKNSFGGDHAGFIASLSSQQATKLRQDESIENIEPDRVVALSTCFTVVEPRLVTWNINRVGFGNGIGKKAWIIDTGIDFDHPDLTVDAAKSKSFIQGVTSADDENGHGTHVAGVIGAKNNSIGVLGVASGATLISLRVLDKDGKGNLSNIIQALAYVNANASAGDVVNMSVGDEDGVSTALNQQVQSTASKGIYFAIAAGNDHDLADKFSPGSANGPTIFTVSAIDSLDNFASFSNYGNDVVDYAMPGVRILSTYMGNRYAYMSGTSMAAPHMAGLLLLKGASVNTSGIAKNDPDGNADRIAHF